MRVRGNNWTLFQIMFDSIPPSSQQLNFDMFSSRYLVEVCSYLRHRWWTQLHIVRHAKLPPLQDKDTSSSCCSMKTDKLKKLYLPLFFEPIFFESAVRSYHRKRRTNGQTDIGQGFGAFLFCFYIIWNRIVQEEIIYYLAAESQGNLRVIQLKIKEMTLDWKRQQM